MAAGRTGEVVLWGSNGVGIKLGWAEDYNALENKSQVRITSCKFISGTYYGTWYMDGTIKINGQTVVSMSSNPFTHMFSSYGGWSDVQKVNAGTVPPWYSAWIEHAPDGTLSVPISVSLSLWRQGSYPTPTDTISDSQNIALTPIPRASAVSVTSGNIGETVSVYINKASENFTHTLTYQFGELTGTIAEQTTESQVPWTLPDGFYTQIPNDQSGIGTVTCITYSGDTNIGTKTATFRAYTVPEDSTPLVEGAAVDVEPVTLNLTNDANRLIRYASRVHATITATARKSASIVQKRINGIVTEQLWEFIKPEASTFIFWATDSRGYTAQAVLTKDIVNYIPVTINPVFYRPQPTTGVIELTFNGNFYQGYFDVAQANQNTLTVQYRYKKSTEEVWSEWQEVTGYTVTNNKFETTSPISLGNGFDYTAMYDFQIQAIDRINTVGVYGDNKIVVSKGLPVFDWGEDDFNINGNLLIGGKSILDWTHPVGSVYRSSQSTEPSILFGGEWVRRKDEFFVAAGDIYLPGSTGGSRVHKHATQGHALTNAQLPKTAWTTNTAGGTGGVQTFFNAGSNYGIAALESGKNQPHNHGDTELTTYDPPYRAYYCWERIA